MPQIGKFTRTQTGYAGHLRTLTLYVTLTLVPAEPSDADNAPDYRVLIGNGEAADLGPEVGAAWKRTGERAGDYVALQLDDPVFAQPIRANLFRAGDDETTWVLNWNRQSKRPDRD